MLKRSATKFRLKLNHQQIAACLSYVGCARFVWNKGLALNKFRLENKQRIMRYQELDFWSKLWKQSEEYGFLADCPSQVLQQKLGDLEKAFLDCFNKASNKRFPRFKKKGQADSIRFPQGFKLKGNMLFLPKLGWLRMRASKKLVGTVKNITLSRQGQHWFVSIQTEQEIAIPVHSATSMLGIDVGIKRFATFSDGTFLEPIHSLKQALRELAIAQRSLSRKKKFSANWQAQKSQVQTIHRRIKNIRANFLHQASHQLCKNHAVLVLEDLKIGNMSKSAKGDLETPGVNVSAKSALNRAILDQGWGEWGRQLEYKQAWRGGEVIHVNPRYTSQTCPSCCHRAKENRITQAEFKCTSCHYAAHADHVGAINVLRAGHARLACGDIASISLQAQEPLEALRIPA